MKQLIVLCLFLLSCYCIQAGNFIDKTGEAISIEVVQPEDLDECKAIFISAFSKAYEEFTPEQLGVKDKLLFLQEAFADVYEDFQNGLQLLMAAKINHQVIGFVGFKQTETPNQIYISQLAVNPDYWQKGIGKHLVFSALDLFEHVNSLVVIPRRINQVA